MKILPTFVILCALLSGCATTEKAKIAHENRAYAQNEAVVEYLKRKASCERNGARMVIKTTASRIRKSYTAAQLKLAQCKTLK